MPKFVNKFCLNRIYQGSGTIKCERKIGHKGKCRAEIDFGCWEGSTRVTLFWLHPVIIKRAGD